MPWHLYILECKGGKLYTGITNNLEHRIKDYNSGSGGRFTKYRRPVKLLYSEEVFTRPEALRREAKVKYLTRKQKLELVNAKKYWQQIY